MSTGIMDNDQVNCYKMSQETWEKTAFVSNWVIRVGNRKAANFRENTNNNNTQVSNVGPFQ